MSKRTGIRAREKALVQIRSVLKSLVKKSKIWGQTF